MTRRAFIGILCRTMIRLPAEQATARTHRKRDSVARSLLHYTPSVLFREIVGMLNTFIRPKLLSPEWFGLWSLLNVIPSYASYLHLGARDYMRFALPQLESRGAEDEARRVEASVFWGALIPNLAVAVALLALSMVKRFGQEARVGLVAMAALVVLTCLYEYCVNVLKGRQMFRDLSRGNYIRSFAQLVLSVTLMLYMGVYGLFIAVPASLLITLVYLATRYPFGETGRFSWPVYAAMVRDGFPLAVFALLMTLMVTAGRLVVAGYLSTEEVGYYALATLALRGMLNFPGAAREVVEPRIMESIASLRDPDTLGTYLYRPLVINVLYLPLLITPLYFLLPPLIEWFLPLYTRGIVPLQLVLFGFYFLAVSYPLRGVIVALRLQKAAALLMVPCLLLNVGWSLVALKLGYGIVGVSLANSASYAVLLLGMAYLLRQRRGIPFPLVMTWPVITAFPVLCASIWASVHWLQPHVGSGFSGAAIQSILLSGSGLAIVLFAGRHISLLKQVSPLAIIRSMVKKTTPVTS